MLDVIIAGAGPAGAVAALVLARAGARVLVVDRDDFPREKLCGDTLNPGAVRLLHTLGLTGGALVAAKPLHGMVVSGPRTVVRATYGEGVRGLALRRRDLDTWLLAAAIQAGARFEPGWQVRGPLVQTRRGARVVTGLLLGRTGQATEWRVPARFTIAADGRRSRVASRLDLVRPISWPRRWAYGAYASNVAGMEDVGEMHIRSGWYLGLAPMPDGQTNVCVVTSPGRGAAAPIELIRGAIASEPAMAARFTRAAWAPGVQVLGPLATDVTALGVRGLLLAGDASGFVDPMTGDGLHLAMQSAALAAEHAMNVLATGDLDGAVEQYGRAHRRRLETKLRFNRVMRRLVDAPGAVDAASFGARLMPGLVRRAIRYAGDVA